MTRRALFVVLLSACKIRNEQSCEIPGVCVDTDGGQTCTGDPDCDAGVCKLPEGRCVGCLDAADCTSANTPVCNTATNSCEGCTVSADCASQACNVATGACFAADQVAYVEAGASGTCDALSPCGSVQQAFDTDRLVIKLQGTTEIVSSAKIVIDRDVLVLGDPGATLPVLRSTGTSTFEVTGDATLTIKDVELSGNTGDGIKIIDNASATLDHVFLLNHTKLGISATSSNKLVMRGCVVAGNDDGGIALSDITFEITNTMLIANGASDSTIGGMRSVSPGPDSIFEFNTIADNTTMASQLPKAGADCSGTAFPAHNNIVAGIAGSLALEPSCQFDHSLFTGAATPLGTGNKATTDVRFDDIASGHERETDFYRLKSDSPAIDQAAASTITVDIDGQLRPQGAEPDMGADEVMP